MSIDTENAKQIREPMVVTGGISAADGIALTYSASGLVFQGNISTTTSGISMRQIADLQGSGFPLDGSCILYDSNDSVDDPDLGKMGYRTKIGQGVTVNLTAGSQVTGITIEVTSGEGTVTHAGETYTLAEGYNIVPVANLTSISLVFTNTSATERLEIASIYSGVSLVFDNDNIISCELDLRASLTPDNPDWQVSEIEWQIYYPYDIASAVTAIGEDVPLTYRAGYIGDMSTLRRFYVTGVVTQEGNVITIKGVDASNKLNKNMPAYENSIPYNQRARRLYQFMKTGITKCGIKLRSAESDPPTSVRAGSTYCLIETNTWKEYIAWLMNCMHDSSTTSTWAQDIGNKRYWPRFVDAGIPTVKWSYPTAAWTIREEDCGDVVDQYEQQINRVEYHLNKTSVQSATAPQETAQELDVKAGATYTVDLGGYYLSLHLSNCRKVYWSKLERIKFQADKTGKCKITGRHIWLNEDDAEENFTAARAGIPLEIDYVFNGYPAIDRTVLGRSILGRSAHIGSFTWHGDPRMQPRDVFTFVRKDGTSVTCTIESIRLKHEGGGTIAEIDYREGVC